MLHILVLVYLFSAANGLLILALDRALGFQRPAQRRLAAAQSGGPICVLS